MGQQHRAARRRAPEPVVFAVAVTVHLSRVIASALRRRAVPVAVHAVGTTARAVLAVLVTVPQLVGELKRSTGAWLRPAVAHTIVDLGGARRHLRQWWRDVALAARPLQEDALAGWRQLTRVDGPAVCRAGTRLVVRAGRRLVSTTALVLGATARGSQRALRRCRVPTWRVVGLSPRVLVPAFALAALAWFAPGPILRLVAGHADVGETPFTPLAQRSVVLAAGGQPLGVVHGGDNRRAVPLAAVPPLVQRLIVAAEDRRFFEHDGFDQAALVRAAVANVRGLGIRQGGSTITQQLVKNNLVGDARTPGRKLQELVLAVAVEERLTKEELLERYLNEVYFGAGAHGIAAAAETYFGTGPDGLRPEQAALLAALIRAPGRLDPWRDADEARARRNAVLGAAADEGVIDPRSAAELFRADLGLLSRAATPQGVDPDLLGVLEREIAERAELGPDAPSRLHRFRTGGWTVETTIVPSLQQAAQRAAAASQASKAPGAAVAAVEPGTGRIRALYSRRPPDVAHLELASSARRQPGSAFKPLAALAALEAGLDPGQRLEGRSGVSFELGDERWEVDNFGDRDHGSVDLPQALRDSVNTAFAQLAVAVGTERLAEVSARLGIDPAAALGPPSQRGPAIALGGLHHGVTPLELATAYAAVANDGAYVEPTVIEHIDDHDGRALLSVTPAPRPAVDPGITRQVRSMLEAVVTDGTGQRASLPGSQPFGKTGTSQDAADAWFVGAVPTLSTAVWVGDPRGRSPMPAATGGTVAAPIWRSVMTKVVGAEPESFPPPGPLPPRPGLPLPTPEPAPGR